MVDKNDWRLTNQINYLKDVKLKYKNYALMVTDHDHCEFCWTKFDEDNCYGYCTIDMYHWICEECYNDFKEMFNWELVD